MAGKTKAAAGGAGKTKKRATKSAKGKGAKR